MFANLLFGTVLIGMTVLWHTVGLILLSRWVGVWARWLRLHRHGIGQTVALMATVLGLFLLHTVEIWSWAVAYVVLGAINGFEEALYFSTVSFSTVGFGDVKIAHQWRQFAALEAIDGFILIGWSIAYLVAASTRHGPFRSGEHF